MDEDGRKSVKAYRPSDRMPALSDGIKGDGDGFRPLEADMKRVYADFYRNSYNSFLMDKKANYVGAFNPENFYTIDQEEKMITLDAKLGAIFSVNTRRGLIRVICKKSPNKKLVNDFYCRVLEFKVKKRDKKSNKIN